MKVDTSNQSICVHLSDGSSPASAAYFRVPWADPILQAGADGMDGITLRRNPSGGSFRLQRARKRHIEMNATNQNWVIDGLEFAYAMDRCLAHSGTVGAGNIQIRNNNISFCGQEGIRVADDTGTWVVESNQITDIQTEPVFERCAGIGSGCLSEFTDNATGIRIINQSTGVSGTVRNNVLLRMGGGMNNRARMINFEHDNHNVVVERNYLAHSSGLANTGTAIMWSGSFAGDSNDDIIVRNNLIYDVDRCFWVQYGTDYPSQAGTNNYILNNHCVEFKQDGLKAESGTDTLDGTFHVKNNIFSVKLADVSGYILDVQSSGSTGWTVLQNNVFECDACTANQDIITWRGTVFERDEDCSGADCIDNMTTSLGASYTGQKYGDINVNTSGGTEPDLTITIPSEAADAGQALTTLVPDDYTGSARPATYDAGAYNIEGEPPPPAGEDIDIAVQRFNLAVNTTGVHSFAFDDFSMDCTVVNCAAIFVVTKAVANDTEEPDALISLGFTDGMNQVTTSVHDNDAASAEVDSRREFRTDRVVNTLESTGITGVAEFYDWNPGVGQRGLRLNITDGFPDDYFITVVIMGGVDFESRVGSFAGNSTVGNSTDVTSVGFLSDIVFLTGARLSSISAPTMLFTFGAAVNDGASTQGAIGCYSQDAQGTSNPHAQTSTLYAAALVDDGGPDMSIEVGSWDSSGFTATTRVVGTTANFGYLALRMGGADISVLDMDTRTTTGTSTHELGYKPLFGMVLGTLARAYDTDEADSDAGLCMIGFGTLTRQFSNTTRVDDGVNTFDSASISNGIGVMMPTETGSCTAGSCFRGQMMFEPSSLDIAYTSVFSDAVRKWIGVAVQDLSETGGGSGGSGGGTGPRRGAGLLQ